MAYPLQYFCLENSMGREAWQITESDTTEQHTCVCIHTHTHTHLGPAGGSRGQQITGASPGTRAQLKRLSSSSRPFWGLEGRVWGQREGETALKQCLTLL